MFRLEFLSEDKVKMTSGICFATEYTIKAVSPVNTKQTDHWEEDTCTNTNRTFHVQWVELLNITPSITSFSKDQAEEVGTVAQDEGITQFHCEAVVGVAGLSSWRK